MPSPEAQVLTVPSTTTGAISSAITSTKIRITSNAACYYSVGAAPLTFAANCEVIPANTVRYINMEGVGNKINLVATSGTALVSIVNCGFVDGTRVSY